MFEKVDKLLVKVKKHRKHKPRAAGITDKEKKAIAYYEELDGLQRAVIELQKKEMLALARAYIDMEDIIKEIVHEQDSILRLSKYLDEEVRVTKHSLKKRKLIWKKK